MTRHIPTAQIIYGFMASRLRIVISPFRFIIDGKSTFLHFSEAEQAPCFLPSYQFSFSSGPNRAMKSSSDRIGIPSSLAFVFLEEVDVTSLFTR